MRFVQRRYGAEAEVGAAAERYGIEGVNFDFDQESGTRSIWQGQGWGEIPPPGIGHIAFTGTGTRLLSEKGRDAIEGLFQRSFG